MEPPRRHPSRESGIGCDGGGNRGSEDDARFRLKRNYDISGFPRQSRVVLQALKEYGMIVADNGSDWYVSGAPDPHWSNDDLHSLGRVPGSAFEVVDTTLLRP